MSGRIYIFTGPTLSAQEGRAELDATFLPPVAQGDVYRATLDKPVAIGIIDGYFERVPAVWHKEILWAMAEGIHVFGAASMGALRAVELAPFGMEGVGAIFESFQRGELEDDDEVAVAHGSAEDGYRLLCEPLVNIRATLVAARAAGVVGPATSAVLERVARELFYMERAWPTVLTRAAHEGVPSVELESLRAGCPGAGWTRSARMPWPCCAPFGPGSRRGSRRSRSATTSSTPTPGRKSGGARAGCPSEERRGKRWCRRPCSTSCG
ncbi:TfuA-like protein [Cystobacter fuscus]